MRHARCFADAHGHLDESAGCASRAARRCRRDLRVAFAIDGRTYASSEAVKRDFDEAYDEMERRRIPMEYETRPVEPHEPASDLPTWAEYRRRLEGGG